MIPIIYLINFMTNSKKIYSLLISLISFSLSHSQSQELDEIIVKLDSAFFDAYNNCNIAKQ